MKRDLKFLLLICVLACAGCSSNSADVLSDGAASAEIQDIVIGPDGMEYTAAEVAEAKELFVWIEHLRKMTPDDKEFIREENRLKEYADFKGDGIVMEISADEAEKLGIRAAVYDKYMKMFSEINANYKNAISQGREFPKWSPKEDMRKLRSEEFDPFTSPMDKVCLERCGKTFDELLKQSEGNAAMKLSPNP